MPLKIYGHPQSSCTKRVLFALEEAGVSYDLSLISMQKGEHKAPTYVNDIHPFGLIPALEDGNFKLFESRAICCYVAATNPGKIGSRPTSPQEFALLEQSSSIDYSYFDPAMKSLAYECLFKSMMGHGPPDQKKIEQMTSQLKQVLDFYESKLADQDYLAGKEFSLIDIYTAPWIAFLPIIKLDSELDSRPNLKVWWGKISARPAWIKVLGMLG